MKTMKKSELLELLNQRCKQAVGSTLPDVGVEMQLKWRGYDDGGPSGKRFHATRWLDDVVRGWIREAGVVTAWDNEYRPKIQSDCKRDEFSGDTPETGQRWRERVIRQFSVSDVWKRIHIPGLRIVDSGGWLLHQDGGVMLYVEDFECEVAS